MLQKVARTPGHILKCGKNVHVKSECMEEA
jgi:hypothetical protein